jgi:hypothetical protein
MRSAPPSPGLIDPALLTASVEKPLQMIGKAIEPESAGVGRKKNERQPHAQGSRRAPMQSEIEADWTALSCACSARLEGLPNACCTRRRARRQAEWQLPARCQDEGNDRGLEAHKITALTSFHSQIRAQLAIRACDAVSPASFFLSRSIRACSLHFGSALDFCKKRALPRKM